MFSIKKKFMNKLKYFETEKKKTEEYKLSMELYGCQDTVKNLEKCSSFLYKDKNGNYFTNSCKTRICPHCSKKKSFEMKRKIHQNLECVLAKNPTLKFINLTLTIKNCEIKELNNVIKHLNSSLKKLLTKKKFKSLKNPEILLSQKNTSASRFEGFVVGFIKRIEITYSENGTAHPHLHVLLACKPSFLTKYYIPKNVVQEMWKEVLGIDYYPEISLQTPKREDLKEIINYIIKPSKSYAELLKSHGKTYASWLNDYAKQISHMHEITFSGIFKLLQKKEPSLASENSITSYWDDRRKFYVPLLEQGIFPFPQKEHSSVSDSFSMTHNKGVRFSSAQPHDSLLNFKKRPYTKNSY